MLEIDVIKRGEKLTESQKDKAQAFTVAHAKKQVLDLLIKTEELAAVARGELTKIHRDVKTHWIVRFTKHRKTDDLTKMPIHQINFNKFEYINLANTFGGDAIVFKPVPTKIKIVNRLPVFEIELVEAIFANYDYKTKHQENGEAN